MRVFCHTQVELQHLFPWAWLAEPDRICWKGVRRSEEGFGRKEQQELDGNVVGK